MLKKFIALTGAMVFTVTSLTATFAENVITVKVDGEEVEFDRPPIVENGRTLIPFRAVLEEMGLYVDWDSDVKAIICTDGEKIGIIVIGESEMLIGDSEQEVIIDSEGGIKLDGERIPLDVPAKIADGRTLVPIRPIVESFGAEVTWDEASKTVEINTGTEKADFDESELEEAADELAGICYGIAYNSDKLDDEVMGEIQNILTEVREYAVSIEEVYSQEDIDKVTEQLKKYTRRLKDFAEENGIDINAENIDENN